MTISLAVIGGSGAMALVPAEGVTVTTVSTEFGAPSGAVMEWSTGSGRVLFVARHGPEGTIPPHRVNYRANIRALQQLGAKTVIGINAVGGISPDATPGRLVIPAQIIDYTWGRDHSFFDQCDRPVEHIDFTRPFSEPLRLALAARARALELPCLSGGVYGVTQGPRLETAAEIDRMERDGCTIVGMTAMPEAALAREAGLDYAVCAMVVNAAAGRGEAAIHDQIDDTIRTGMVRLGRLVEGFASAGDWSGAE